ncbi:hypothetical protein ABIB35_001850 [Arthrobacter sp. UYP6]
MKVPTGTPRTLDAVRPVDMIAFALAFFLGATHHEAVQRGSRAGGTLQRCSLSKTRPAGPISGRQSAGAVHAAVGQMARLGEWQQ